MALLPCTECGHSISDLAAACPHCGHPQHTPAKAQFAESPTQTPTGAPTATDFKEYAEVPWYRRSSWNTLFILVGFGSKGYLPLTLVTCILLLTGDVYFKDKDSEGRLKRWGRANKYAAVLLLVLNVGYLLYALVDARS